MSERPILFSGLMVRAILEGRKTETRRIVSFPPWVSERDKLTLAIQNPATGLAEYDDGRPVRRMTCPYGAPGDRLWVRETFCVGYPTGDGHYSALPWTGADEHRDGKPFYAADRSEKPDEPRMPWRPSIHMPHWASRITLEVTGVCVERLQAISEEDARAEGVTVGKQVPATIVVTDLDGKTKRSKGTCADLTARGAFCHLWDGINGERADWASNPWVWVVSFKRVQA